MSAPLAPRGRSTPTPPRKRVAGAFAAGSLRPLAGESLESTELIGAALPPIVPPPVHRQRGYYSERLGEPLSEFQRNQVTAGATADNRGKGGGKQRLPSVSSFRPRAPAGRPTDGGFAGPAAAATLSADTASWDVPARALEPKVQSQYETLPGRIPRKIEIERRKRLYAAQDIGALLRAEGVDYSLTEAERSASAAFRAYLPLEPFDDTEYEVRLPEEWLALGLDGAEMRGVPARGLFMGADGVGTWAQVRVVDYDVESGRYLVKLWPPVAGGPTEALLHRLSVLFNAEDPFNFAARVGAAYRARRDAEALLRCNLYIDSMPTKGLSVIEQASVNRMLAKTLRGPPTETQLSFLESLVAQVAVDHARAMNKIVFDRNRKDPEQRDQFAFLTLPPDPLPPPVRYYGTVETAPYDYAAAVQSFSFLSFLTKSEVIATTERVRIECNRVLAMGLFATHATKSLRLDEFETMQNQAAMQTVSYLKDAWKTNLRNAIRATLKEVGKGWFNLNERSREVYEVSKLKKLMVMVRFMMQDTLRSLTNASLAAFRDLIVAASPVFVAVEDTDVVHVEMPADQIEAAAAAAAAAAQLDAGGDSAAAGAAAAAAAGPSSVPGLSPAAIAAAAARKYALFSLDLIVREDTATYSTKPRLFREVPIMLFERAVASLSDLPQLEPEVLQELFWASRPLLEVVSRLDPAVLALKAEIDAALTKSIAPLDAYLATYDRHAALIRLDPAAYVAAFESAVPAKTTQDYRAEILAQQAEEEAIDARVPRAIVIGMFRVNCELVRNLLLRKRRDLARLLLESLARRTCARADEICAKFEDVQARLVERPSKIEEAVELEGYLAKVPAMSREYARDVEALLVDYELLEECRHNLSPDDFGRKWTAIGWQRSIEESAAATAGSLEKDRVRFERDLVSDQEAFAERLEELARGVSGLSRHTDIAKVDEVAAEVLKLEKQIEAAQARVQLFHSREHLFGRGMTEYEDLAIVIKQFEPYQKLWLTTRDWLGWQDAWLHGPFNSLDAQAMQRDLASAWTTMFKLVRVFKDAPRCLEIATTMKAQMDDFKPHVPLIVALRNRGMRDRHWAALADKLGSSIRPTDGMSFVDIRALSLDTHIAAIEEVASVASREYAIEAELDRMLAEWEGTSLEIVEYPGSETFIVRNTDPIIQLLDDHIVMTQAMSFSVYRKHFEERIKKWEDKLALVQATLERWLLCQKQWLYLQPIFSSEDINRQMVVEGKRFATMDRMWRKNLGAAAANPRVLAVCKDDRLLESFDECIKLLDLVQKGLTEYLETKRGIFPRFYFLSDDDMLEILSQTKDPTAVQRHLCKCFENIASLEFSAEHEIRSMNSGEGENVPFVEHFYPKGNVENWLLDVERVMKASVKQIIKRAVAAYPKSKRPNWVAEWPAQAVLVVSQIYWTQQVTAAIRASGVSGLRKLRDVLVRQINELTELVRMELPLLTALTLSPLIILDVHARDVTQRLIDAAVSAESDFEWMSQLRQYWEDGDVAVKMANAGFTYGYEYLGNTTRLVITPLTDRCYLTLTGALHLQMGGAPQGPAGTGKTETTKDLAKALAKQCVVFNCQGTLDHIAMGKFFKGLASSGAWACFDEFNRIELEVLSVIATQILQIQRAIQGKLKRFTFEEVQLSLDPTCAVFITMNPGYAGRAELPDNLKALFRPVAMMVPDYTMIAEIMFFSYGFTDASPLSRKMTATFRLSSEQLSTQTHYDFGMRAVKTVISAAGNLKREDPTKDESIILLQALKDCNVPKFLEEDLMLFNGIIADLFPGVVEPVRDYGSLERAIVEALTERGLQAPWQSIHKAIQLYETTVVRHGLMLVGPTGGGKTTTYRILAAAMTKLRNDPKYAAVHYSVINPKAITMEQLYGCFDPNTHEWTEGVLANIVREGAEDPRPDKQWVVFDGPVDALWIENMNTVLDDNKKLCLSSGKIIPLSKYQTMIFEVEDLAVASPATVSRCGMVYMEPQGLGLRALVKSWLLALPPALAHQRDRLEALFECYAVPAIAFVRSVCFEPVRTADNNLLASLTRILDAFIATLLAAEEAREDLSPAAAATVDPCVEQLFVFALIWSVGATCDAAGRVKFDRFLREKMAAQPHLAFTVEASAPQSAAVAAVAAAATAAAAAAAASAATAGSAADDAASAAAPLELAAARGFTFPPEGLVYDWLFDFAKTKSWASWLSTIAPFEVDKRTPFADIIVPTIDSVRYSHLLDLLLRAGKHMLCVGPTGTGKSVVVGRKIMSDMPASFEAIVVNFSAQTSENVTQDILDSKFTRRRRNQYGPPAGKRFVIFVDDINMPAKDEYGAQGPIELLRQWMDHKGWYDRKSLQFQTILDIVLVGACGPAGGARSEMTARFKRHFNMLSFTELSPDSLARIFGTILGSFLEPFEASVKAATGPVVAATIELYEAIQRERRPTPSRTHYTFNLRDMSKVFQGLLLASRAEIGGSEDLVRLWTHECARVFFDRLVDAPDRGWFVSQIQASIRTHFGMSWDRVIGPAAAAAAASDPATAATSIPIVFADFLVAGADPRVYALSRDPKALIAVVEEQLEEYNALKETPMPLVMFDDAVQHIARIVRAIRQPQGNCLLLGMGGSGRRSLAKLAAFIAGYDVFQIVISKSYGVAEWHDDLRRLFWTAGAEGKPLVFLFTDTEIVAESFLEDINNILNAGIVPNIHRPDEMEQILETMRPIVANLGLPLNKTTIFDQFVKRVRANIHLVLAMSPIGDRFRNRIRMFPALINCSTIDWFSRWPDDALLSVASAALAGVRTEVSEQVFSAMVSLAQGMHQTVLAQSERYLAEVGRYNYVTPASFLEMLGLYATIKAEKAEDFATRKKRLQVGLERLVKTRETVEVLQSDLEAMQPHLAQLQKDVDATMVKINTDKEAAAKSRVLVLQEEESARRKAKECEEIAASAKQDLDEAMPSLNAAIEALDKLDKAHLVEIKALPNPPIGVRMVMSAMCIMMGKKPVRIDDPARMGRKIDDYWSVAKSVLSNPIELLRELTNYPRDDIPEAVIEKIRPYIEDEEFQPEKVARSSQACMSICAWIRAMDNYHKIATLVAPKRAAHAAAKASLDATLAGLREAQAKLGELEASIRELELRYEESLASKEELQGTVENTKRQLGRAHKLIDGLADEKDRWRDGIALIDVQSGCLVGDALLSAGIIGYLGAFTSPFRDAMTRDWLERMVTLGIPHTADYAFRSVLSSPIEIRKWALHGLPNDTLSTENGVFVNYSRRWCLMIDPQGQANKWIRSMEAEAGLDVVKLSEKDYLRTLGNAIRFGKPVLIENVGDELDPALESILLKQVVVREGGPAIKVGDQEIPYRDDFKLYLTTKLPNPHYTPETSTKVTLLNFTLSREGLEEQLLGLVVARERPDLEDTKNHLVSSNARMRSDLKDTEDRILYLLSSAQGNPLEDEVLIEELANSKKVSLEIQHKVVEQEATEREIDTTRLQYQTVAVRARILFFCIRDLAGVDPMYQYALNWFLNLFVAGLANSEPDEELQARLANIESYFTLSLYRNICRSLFARHKLLFSFLLCVRIVQDQRPDEIDADEWRFLLAGSALIVEDAPPNPDPSWLTEVAWASVVKLDRVLPRFKGFAEFFVREIRYFKGYFDSAAPHQMALPGAWESRLTQFQKMIVLRCLRMDKVSLAIEDYVSANLSHEFVIAPRFDLPSVYRDSSAATPLIFVLSAGADPGADLYKFAVEMRFGKKLASISLGRGQGERAEAMITEAMERGTWVLLENCHLATSWLGDLERIVASWDPVKLHRDFRLWLTSMPSAAFPVLVLQESIKITQEPPRGLRSNLLRSYLSMEESYLEQAKSPTVFRKLLFSLCFFHGIVQERRKFGALGWNIAYEFTMGDLEICMRQLHMFLESYEAVPYDVLLFLAGQVNYGGRVTDDWDRRTLMTILGDFYRPAVLSAGHSFLGAGDAVYVSPEVESVKAYVGVVEGLPHNDPPSLFGMHDNADITCAQNNVASMFQAIVALQPRASAAASGSREETIRQTATDILARVPQPFDEKAVSAGHPLDPMQSMSTVLIQEVLRYNKLLSAVRRSARDLLDALAGRVVMSRELEDMASALYNNQVPKMWAKVAYPSLKPLASWVLDLVARVAFIAGWAASPGHPPAYWISGLFFPQAFLTGTLQNFARKYKTSVDTLSWEFEVLPRGEPPKSPPADGCYVYGMFLEGARWDSAERRLAESRAKELFTELPTVWLKPVADRPRGGGGVFRCPLYKTLERAGTLSTTGHSTNYVLTVELASNEDERHWVGRGVALICALSD